MLFVRKACLLYGGFTGEEKGWQRFEGNVVVGGNDVRVGSCATYIWCGGSLFLFVTMRLDSRLFGVVKDGVFVVFRRLIGSTIQDRFSRAVYRDLGGFIIV